MQVSHLQARGPPRVQKGRKCHVQVAGLARLCSPYRPLPLLVPCVRAWPGCRSMFAGIAAQPPSSHATGRVARMSMQSR